MTGVANLGADRGPRHVSAAEVRGALSLDRAVEALERGVRTRAGEPGGMHRTVVDIPGNGSRGAGELLLMPARGPEGAGVKLVSIVGDNPSLGLPLIQGVYVLFSAESLTPELTIDGAALTELRTVAVSVLATRHLARADSSHLVVFGAGVQGISHADAMRTIFPLQRITIVASSPHSPRARSLVSRLSSEGVDARVGTARDIATADLICACTTSTEPLFDDADVRPGTHINAVGAYRLDMCEIPGATLARGLRVVESLTATLREAGDIVTAIEAGLLPRTGFAHPLRDVLTDHVRRADDRQVTIFKSVGISSEDLILARALAEALARPGE